MSQPVYITGYLNALEWISKASEEELVDYLNCLQGTEKLPFRATLEQIRREAHRQARIEFLNPLNDNYRKFLEMEQKVV